MYDILCKISKRLYAHFSGYLATRAHRTPLSSRYGLKGRKGDKVLEFMIGTPIGAEVIVQEAPEFLGQGVLIRLRMHKIGDSRHAEVFLDQGATEVLYDALRAHRTRLKGIAGKETDVRE